ncbi:hypothetical protein [Candidatus Brocadia sinica]|uniref:Ribonuclease HI n=1 Tax=Candidatus Brocadia sinica JPN1 TaxID=1197129 RepID=A0ABQ0K023_9BACT|nr:hypothetical protein [Candidatus Brocadia sinica]GAN34360.1 ribonuclease HI [Candidatus Brocadia sinica JPN1]
MRLSYIGRPGQTKLMAVNGTIKMLKMGIKPVRYKGKKWHR